MLTAAEMVLDKWIIPLSLMFRTAFRDVTYGATPAKQCLLQMPLVVIRIGEPHRGNSQLYIMEYVQGMNYVNPAQFLETSGISHAARPKISKGEMKKVLAIAQDRERKCLRYAIYQPWWCGRIPIGHYGNPSIAANPLCWKKTGIDYFYWVCESLSLNSSGYLLQSHWHRNNWGAVCWYGESIRCFPKKTLPSMQRIWIFWRPALHFSQPLLTPVQDSLSQCTALELMEQQAHEEQQLASDACYCGVCHEQYVQYTDTVQNSIGCDACDWWYHFTGVGLTSEPDDFICEECSWTPSLLFYNFVFQWRLLILSNCTLICCAW